MAAAVTGSLVCPSSVYRLRTVPSAAAQLSRVSIAGTELCQAPRSRSRSRGRAFLAGPLTSLQPQTSCPSPARPPSRTSLWTLPLRLVWGGQRAHPDFLWRRSSRACADGGFLAASLEGGVVLFLVPFLPTLPVALGARAHGALRHSERLGAERLTSFSSDCRCVTCGP